MSTFVKSVKNKEVLLSVAMVAFVGPSKVHAVTTNNFTVTASLVASCTIATTEISFGSYTLAQLDNTSTVTVTCTTGSNVKIGLNAGAGAGATVSARKMTSGADTLSYALYQDSSRTTNWGNTPGVDTVNTTGTSTPQVFTVYGRIPANQTSPIGAYTDIIIATVNFS